MFSINLLSGPWTLVVAVIPVPFSDDVAQTEQSQCAQDIPPQVVNEHGGNQGHKDIANQV
jgi:hypothetical protein